MEKIISVFALLAFAAAAIGIAFFAPRNPGGQKAGHKAKIDEQLRQAHDARREFEINFLILENEMLKTGRVDQLAREKALASAARHPDSAAMTKMVNKIIGNE
jgi:hypothetical protein